MVGAAVWVLLEKIQFEACFSSSSNKDFEFVRIFKTAPESFRKKISCTMIKNHLTNLFKLIEEIKSIYELVR